jgi:acyl-CoA synthetase (AMP-forming)/AMP-acid ligase II/thioesterase domain-containing protein
VLPGGVVVTYGELADFIAGIAAALRAEGMAGTRIGTMLDGLAAALMLPAVPSVAVCAPMNPNLAFDDLKQLASAVEVDALVVTKDSEPLGQRLAAVLDIDLFSLDFPDPQPTAFRLQRLSRRAGPPAEPRADDGVAFLMRSSGTTGNPKIIPITHRNVCATPEAVSKLLGITAEDRSACTMPLYYAAGLKQTLLSPLLMGGSICVPPKSERQAVSAWIRELQPTWMSSSPASLRGLLDGLDPADRLPLPGVKFMLSAGSLVTEALQLEAEARLRIPVLPTYGLTEAGVVAANPPPPGKRRPGTVGVSIPGLLTIRDDAGGEAPRGVEGGAHVRGDVVMPGYVGLEPRGDGWLDTGDLGVMDEDGYLTITGRSKEMINRGGEKISPYDIEAAALEHPAVLEAGAFGVPHARLGESPALAVVLRPDHELTPSALRDFVAERLSGFKAPRAIYIRPELPRTSTGKLRRDALRNVCGPLVKESVPPLEPLEYQLLEIWEALLQRSDIGVEHDFFEAGGDSLLAERMLMEIEELTRRTISSAELGPVMTIRGLSEIISAGAAQDWALITCARPGTGAPFYFCHGDYTTRGFYALKLADLMALQRPVHLIHPAYDAHAARGLRNMAAACVEQMVAEQPTGDFDLGGYCNGGLLAWEIADQLAAKGRKVARLILLDTMSLNARPALRTAAWFLNKLPGSVRLETGRASWMMGVWRLALLRLDWRDAMKRGIRTLAAGPGLEGTRPDTSHMVLQAMADYVPPHLGVETYCLTAADSARLPQFNPTAWKNLSPGVLTTVLPGNHQTSVTIYVQTLADAMRGILEPREDVASDRRRGAGREPRISLGTKGSAELVGGSLDASA